MKPFQILMALFSDFFMAALHAIHDNGGTWLADTAEAAVGASDGVVGDGNAKRMAAFKAIEDAAIAAGKTIVPWVVNLAIEIAVAKLKA